MIEIIYNHPNRKKVRRKLRKNSTPQEDKLWSFIRNSKSGIKLRRQYSVSGYVIDFYCSEKRLAIEIDGSHHLKNKEYDENRTKLSETFNIRVLRFWNNEIDKEINKVLEKIKSEIF